MPPRARPRRPLATLLWALAFLLACSLGSEASQESASNPHTGEAPAATGPEDPAALQAELEAWMDLERRDFPLLIWAAVVIEHDYHAPARFDLARQADEAFASLAREEPSLFARRSGGRIELRVGDATASFELPLGPHTRLRDLAAALEGPLRFTGKALAAEPERLHELEYALLNGLLAPLDPHTVLLTPDEHADLGVRTRGRFGGLGIQIRSDGRHVLIEAVLPETPAQRAGLLAGDRIVRVDGRSTLNMELPDAQEILRGPVGSEVVLSVLRGKKTLRIAIVRAEIRLQSVQAHRLPGGVGYLRISTFQEDTAQKTADALAAFTAGGPLSALLLDLRGNSGGLLTQATAMLDHFVSEGELVVVQSALGREVQSASAAMALPATVPILALIDERSASAAEILSGGLVQLERGVVLGRTSFGKGTVQMLKPSTPYGEELALKLTVAEYGLAAGGKIQGRGVRPDLRLHPVYLQPLAGVLSAFDVERFERERERSVTVDHPSSRAVGSKRGGSAGASPPEPESSPVLRFVVAEGELSADTPAPLRDPELRAAHAFARALGEAGGGTRAAALRQIDLSLPELSRAADEAIAAAMKRSWGESRWSSGPAQLDPAAGDPALELRVELEGPSPRSIADSLPVRVRVRNLGSQTLTRTRVLSDCDHDELDGIEYLFGELAPGAEKSERLRLAFMPWHPSLRTDLGFVAFADQGGARGEDPLARAHLPVEVIGEAPPLLAVDAWIVDSEAGAGRAPPRPAPDPSLPPSDFRVRGNGDARLQAGERVLLAFRVRNLGPGRSEATVLRMRNLGGKIALLEEGQLALGTIGPGKAASGSLGLSVAEEALAGAELATRVVVGDTRSRTYVEGEFDFHVGEGDAPWTEPSADALARVRGPSLEFGELPTSTRADRVEVSVRAEHPREVLDLVAWARGSGGPLSERKVAYTRQSAQGEAAKGLVFTFELELEPGANHLRVLARDGEGVETRRDRWIYREAP